MENFNPKPLKTGTEHGIPVIKQMVSNEVRQVLTLMEANPGSYINRLNIFNFGKLYIKDQPPIRIEQGFLIPILEYCRPNGNYVSDNITQYELHPLAMKTIRICDL